jgi:hypothetical protein
VSDACMQHTGSQARIKLPGDSCIVFFLTKNANLVLGPSGVGSFQAVPILF